MLRDFTDLNSLNINYFCPFFQPIVKFDSKGYKVFGYEVLMRYIYNNEVVPIAKYIDLFEETGQIVEIDKIVIKKAMYLKKQHELLKDAILFVNLSPVEFKSLDMLQEFIDIIDEYGINHEEICFEITERQSISQEDIIVSANFLKDKNFLLAVDDLGSGYSGLTYLVDLPVDFVKIEKHFVKNLKNNLKIAKLVNLIKNFCSELNIDIICEGIETKELMLELKMLGFKYMQGYYFGKPVSIDEFEFIEKIVIQNFQQKSINVEEAIKNIENAVHTDRLKILEYINKNVHINMQTIAKLISQDTILTAKILKIANSPAYGFPKKIASVHHAVTILGLNIIKTIVFFLTYQPNKKLSDFKKQLLVKQIYKNSSRLIKLLNLTSLKHTLNKHDFDVITTGLLVHYIGRLSTILLLDDDEKDNKYWFLYNGKTWIENERQLFGVDYLLVNKMLAYKWQLPSIIESIMTSKEIAYYDFEQDDSDKFGEIIKNILDKYIDFTDNNDIELTTVI